MSEAETSPVVERGEIVGSNEASEDESRDKPTRDEFIEQPAKVMRVGTMMKQLLDEVRSATLDEASRDRLREIYETSVRELGSALSPDLREELGRLALPFSDSDAPSSAELQIAQAQLVGWLEGLIQGIQATLWAQQMAAQQQLANMRGQIGPGGRPGAGSPRAGDGDGRPGTYL
ncbi:MAG TPA: proteasome activator [Acidimicrobiales bacterium]